ncbi:conjugal transfer protein TraU [Vibrio sp. V27_P1S3P104]|nr:conjugal transfer protein TraU [Vibrio sp. V29_P1S30P107]NAX38057.1 conjugal transfer protein TraU [Vibrio sp. V27_P1S3P104]
MKKALCGLTLALLISPSSYAGLGECDNAGILSNKMITDVPWNAMYPIRLAGIKISPTGGGAPHNSTNRVFCSCEDDLGIPIPGFTNSMYEPARLIELVREPDCMMSLGGAKMSMTNGRARGTIGENAQEAGESHINAFWHYHYFAFPLLMMLEMLVPNRCGDGFMSMDLLYVSELDPTWNDAELAAFANVESILFANPIALASCFADGVAAAVGKPIDEMFWCAGTWGGLYPLTGYISTKSSIPSKTSLLATRAVAALHRRLLARQTVGDDALCDAPIYPTIPKSQYKMNMMYPVPERGGQSIVKSEKSDGTVETNTVNLGEAHEIGEPTMIWGEWRNIPSKEDAIYLLWRYNDCCTTYY